MRIYLHSFLLLALVTCGCKPLEASPVKSARAHFQLPLWPGSVPDARSAAGPEIVTVATEMVAGKPWHWV